MGEKKKKQKKSTKIQTDRVSTNDEISKPARIERVIKSDEVCKPARVDRLNRPDEVCTPARGNRLNRPDEVSTPARGNRLNRPDEVSTPARGNRVGRPDVLAKPVWGYIVWLIGLTLVAVLTRLHKIQEPNHVCWDETHFGKMGSYYINRTFFFDVHPPLGKMLIGLSGLLTGYDGGFDFNKPGDDYGDTPYVGMRMFCALLGSALVPLCFATVWQLTSSLTAAVLAAVLVICDTGLLTLTQYILLDPVLLFFIMTATFSLLKFRNISNRPFGIKWWIWLCLTGVSLSCAVGVKFVGLFVIVLAGFTTATDLWQLLGDLTLPLRSVIKHLVARILGLIVLPGCVYLLLFAVHFKVLSKSGSGDGFFSSSFQAQLEGNPLYNASMPEKVAFGSVITIKNHRTGGAYLHSHWHLYPDGVGAKQQQVTTYAHKDENNKWLVNKLGETAADSIEYIKNNDLIQLQHLPTKRNLHSHREYAPVTKKHYQVTCYGENGTGDNNDLFRVEIEGGYEKEPLRTVRSIFRLVHVNADCALHSHNKQLPKWGWEQMEVTCNPYVRDNKNRWNVEEVFDDRLANVSFEVYGPSFLEMLLESHAVMLQSNSGLKPKEGEVTSQPWQWPIDYRGQPFSGPEYRVYLLGNPVLWWCLLVIKAIFLLLYVFHAARKQRGYHVPKQIENYREQTFKACSWLLLGWAVHYFPFWFMGRVLYFHHYFPALLFSIMLSAIMVDYLVTCLCQYVSGTRSWTIRHTVLGVISSLIVYSFFLFSPLSYGVLETETQNDTALLSGLRWLDSWDI